MSITKTNPKKPIKIKSTAKSEKAEETTPAQQVEGHHHHHPVAGIFHQPIQSLLVSPLFRNEATHGDSSSNKRCKCNKSRCLKLYCNCFSNGVLCNSDCRCQTACENKNRTKSHRKKRNETILEHIKANANTFRSPVNKIEWNEAPVLKCHCEKTRCLKGKCVCYREGVPCGIHCACVDCGNNKQNGGLLEKCGETHAILSKFVGESLLVPLSFQDDKANVPDTAFTLLPMSQQAAKPPSAMDHNTNGVRQILMKRTFDEMKGQLLAEMTGESTPRSIKGRQRTDKFAGQIITTVKAQLKQILQAADLAGEKVRERAEGGKQRIMQEMAQLSPPTIQGPPKELDYGKIIPLGTTFTKGIDVLGEFEGTVVSVPNTVTPFYRAEYSNGGTETLLHPALVALLRTSREKWNVDSARTDSRKAGHDMDPEAQNKVRQLVRHARETVILESLEALLIQNL